MLKPQTTIQGLVGRKTQVLKKVTLKLQLFRVQNQSEPNKIIHIQFQRISYDV